MLQHIPEDLGMKESKFISWLCCAGFSTRKVGKTTMKSCDVLNSLQNVYDDYCKAALASNLWKHEGSLLTGWQPEIENVAILLDESEGILNSSLHVASWVSYFHLLVGFGPVILLVTWTELRVGFAQSS